MNFSLDLVKLCLGFWCQILIYVTNVVILTLIPCILDMARSGRRARNVRIVLNAWILPIPARLATKFIADTWYKLYARLRGGMG